MIRLTPLVALLSVAMAWSAASADDRSPTFEHDVLPILTRQCLSCHGGLRKKGELDLRTISAMLQGGESGPAVASGDPGQSELWQMIASDEMPSGNRKLPDGEKEIIRRWIAAGLPTAAGAQRDAPPLLRGDGRHSPLEVAAAIDQQLDRALAASKVPAAPRCDDAEFLRRAYLDLAGRVPTAAQAAAFLDDDDENKRAQLIDTLLAAPQFGEQFGRTWREWVCPPELPSDPNSGKQPHKESHAFGKWLGQRINDGDTWDKIVREILIVEGELKNQPQVVFHGLVGEGGKPSAAGAARAVGSLFLGVQLQCAECHDDPYRTWSQDEYWALAAFFRNTSGDFNKITESGEKNKKREEATAEGIVIPKSAFINAGKVVSTRFLRGDAYAGQPRSLREPLVQWLTARDNPYFAKALTNRMWFYLFARGLVMPVDDFRDLNPPSHPELMSLLAQEFAASGYDIKHLLRCICNSQAYQRTSRIDPQLDHATAAAQLAGFGRMPLRVMTADVLYDSLKLAYGDPNLDLRAIDPKDGNTNGESAPVGDPYLEFLRRFGTNEDDASDFTHGIPQLLTLVNHPRLLTASAALDDYFKKQKPEPSAEQTIEWLYLSTLSRRPSAEEVAEARDYLARAPSAGTSAYLGILWMLINRSEYLLIR